MCSSSTSLKTSKRLFDMMGDIVFVGLNPCVQSVLTIDGEIDIRGGVNRCRERKRCESGKGINAGRGCDGYQSGVEEGRVKVVVVHFVGGSNGGFVRDAVDSNGWRQLAMTIQAETRNSQTILYHEDVVDDDDDGDDGDDDGDEGDGKTDVGERKKNANVTKKKKRIQHFEVIDPSPTVTTSEREAMMQMIVDYVREEKEKVKALAFCGTTPMGISPDFFVDVTIAAKKVSEKVIVLLDGTNTELIAAGLVDILKINRSELLAITSRFSGNNSNSSNSMGGNGKKNLTIDEAVRLFVGHYGENSARWVAVTDGPNPAYLYCISSGVIQHGWKYLLPPGLKTVNCIGAGDCCTGVLLCQLVRNKNDNHVDCFRMALAAAAASTMVAFPPSAFETSLMYSLFDRIKVSVV
jgi:fructose-1-phosphate kinase PfkB-like protein